MRVEWTRDYWALLTGGFQPLTGTVQKLFFFSAPCLFLSLLSPIPETHTALDPVLASPSLFSLQPTDSVDGTTHLDRLPLMLAHLGRAVVTCLLSLFLSCAADSKILRGLASGLTTSNSFRLSSLKGTPGHNMSLLKLLQELSAAFTLKP